MFKIGGQPQGKGRPRFTRSGHAFTPQATRDYEKLIAEEYKAAKGDTLDGYIKVNIKAYYKIPKATSKEKRGMIERGLLKPAVKPDIDNVIKAILDGLNGVAYHDDNQVVYVDAEKFYADEPCVIVEVSHYE
ncbi:MAG: RusA family crossover junction endodeoxyribonuclease [Clostridia bacterium]|nr:RusA family crossover junction endodeoxyribonuclease [Clostridia bacterium]